MSRRNKRRPQSNRPTVVVQERPQEQRRQPNIRPGATNFKPLSDSVLQTMYANMGPQASPDAMYAPGAPLRPMPGLVPKAGIRGWDYTTGHNIGKLPRSTEIYSFADLRALSSMYYGVQMCQQVWFDYISQLELDIQPRKDLIGEDGDTSMYEDDIQFYKDFFAYPDKDHDLHSWLQMAVKDQLEIDAVAIYPRQDRAGRLYSLDLIDAAMMTPLVDDRGRKPLPPFPAYEQYVHGVPAALLTSEDLIYIKETERTDSVYGRSRVEKIILNINIALRKQTKDLAHFTDGNLPPGFIQPSMDVQWSQEEIESWEMQLNNVLAGNDELRARLKVLPRGFEYKSVLDSDDIHAELDQLILNITAACHGLTMAELAFVADVNRSTGDSQENVVYRRAMGPLMKRYARFFTMILQKYFKERRFIVSFRGYTESEDLQSTATAYSTLTGAGILGISDAAKLMKLPEDPDAQHIGRLIVTKDGPIFLDDMASSVMREAQIKAKLAGLDMAANPPMQAPSGGAPPGQASTTDTGEEENEEETSPAVKRLMSQVEEILARLNRVDSTDWEDVDDGEDETERMITDLLIGDADEPYTELERSWAAFDAKRQPKGRKHATQQQTEAEQKEQAEIASQVKAQLAQLASEKQEAKQDNAEKSAQAKEAKAEAAQEKREAAAKQRAEKQQAHLQKQAAAAQAKAARLAQAAQKKAQAAAARAARAQAKLAKAQARAALKEARSEQKAAKVLQRLIRTIGTKAQLYSALSSRKSSKSWTAKDASDAQAIAGDLSHLMDLVTSHANESSATGLLNHLTAAIDDMHVQKGLTSARASMLEKLAGSAQAQMQRSMQEDESWYDADFGAFDDFEIDGEEEEAPEKRYTIGELLTLLTQQMQGQTAGAQDAAEAETIRARVADLRAQGVKRLTWKSTCSCDICQQNNGVMRALGSPFPSGHVIGPCHDGCPCEMEYHSEPPTEREIVVELNKWRSCAVHDVKDGRKIREFTTALISSDLYTRIASGLEECRTVGDVRVVFDRAKGQEGEAPFFAHASESGGNREMSSGNWKPKW